MSIPAVFNDLVKVKFECSLQDFVNVTHALSCPLKLFYASLMQRNSVKHFYSSCLITAF